MTDQLDRAATRSARRDPGKSLRECRCNGVGKAAEGPELSR